MSQMRRNNCWFGLSRSDLVGPVFELMMGWDLNALFFLLLGLAFAFNAVSPSLCPYLSLIVSSVVSFLFFFL